MSTSLLVNCRRPQEEDTLQPYYFGYFTTQ